MEKMKFMGLDFGTKRMGVALSDDGGTLAFPKEILPNDQNFFGSLFEIIKNENVSEIVVGESTDSKGAPNPVAKDIEIFVAELKKRFSLPVKLQKEFLTTVEARRYQEDAVPADASAAALILQRYLDKINKAKQ